jgi:hypothetical protein
VGAELKLPYIVVGATTRDLPLFHVFASWNGPTGRYLLESVQDIPLDGIRWIAVGGMSPTALPGKRGQYAAGTARKRVHPSRTRIRSTIKIQGEQGGDAGVEGGEDGGSADCHSAVEMKTQDAKSRFKSHELR